MQMVTEQQHLLRVEADVAVALNIIGMDKNMTTCQRGIRMND